MHEVVVPQESVIQPLVECLARSYLSKRDLTVGELEVNGGSI